jgi:hypothetical protein
MHNKFSCGHAVLENNLRENSSLSYLLTKPTKQVFKFVRTKTETCALKLETIRGPSALSVYMSNLCRYYRCIQLANRDFDSLIAIESHRLISVEQVILFDSCDLRFPILV